MPFIELAECRRLFYESRGQGRPIVFVHGWSASHELWQGTVTRLERACRTVAYDQRGHGRSSGCSGPFTMAAYSRDLAVLLEQLELDDVVLVGWSMGVVVALDFMRRDARSRIGKLVLLSGSPRLMKATGWPFGFDANELSGLGHSLQADRAATTRAFLGQLMRRGHDPEILDLVTRVAMEMPFPAAVESFQSELEADLRGVLEDIEVPTLVVHGDEDHPVCLGASDFMMQKLPRAERVQLPRSGHYGPLESPVALGEAIERFAAS